MNPGTIQARLAALTAQHNELAARLFGSQEFQQLVRLEAQIALLQELIAEVEQKHEETPGSR